MRKHQFLFLPLIFAVTNLPLDAIFNSSKIPEDAKLNFTQLAKKYNCSVEEYDIVTEDGYILTLFHMPGDKRKSVLLMHGILDTADTFIIRGKTSLAVTLYKKGFDIWIGNLRGSKYSRRHVNLNPDLDRSFWDFYVHEFGVHDIPAIMDFIMHRGVQNISVIAHSQGNMAFFVLGSEKPEYNDKINLMIALGPVCYLNKIHFKYPVKTLVQTGPLVSKVLQMFDQEEIFGDDSILTYLRDSVCTKKVLGYKLCAENIFFQLGGKDGEEFEPEFFYSVIGHYPSGTSRKNAEHLVQIADTGKFTQYDYGLVENLKVYGAESPPLYNISKVRMKVALIAGRNDNITPLANVKLLKKQLPNVVSYNLMDRHPKFNHIDHVWGRHMDKYLFPDVLKLLGKYA